MPKVHDENEINERAVRSTTKSERMSDEQKRRFVAGVPANALELTRVQARYLYGAGFCEMHKGNENETLWVVNREIVKIGD